jgi:uncharacterized protein YeaO (DUF488 family)
MIRVGSVYDFNNGSERGDDALRVLVMRKWPRGIRRAAIDVWLKDAAPSASLLQAYHHDDIGWQEFEQRYRHEILRDRPSALEDIRGLEREYGSLTLLCFERIPPAEHCHRQVLLELLSA